MEIKALCSKEELSDMNKLQEPFNILFKELVKAGFEGSLLIEDEPSKSVKVGINMSRDVRGEAVKSQLGAVSSLPESQPPLMPSIDDISKAKKNPNGSRLGSSDEPAGDDESSINLNECIKKYIDNLNLKSDEYLNKKDSKERGLDD